MACLSTLLLLFFLAFASFSSAEFSSHVGVCYGQLGNNLPLPKNSVDLIKGLKAKRVKIYDANPEILKALKGTDLLVSVMVPNDLINNISSNQTLADQWVKNNVVPHYPHTMIRYLLVGNEILSNPPNTTWFNLVPAIRKIRSSVKKFGLGKIKVGTPLAIDMLESSFPPSNAQPTVINLDYALLDSKNITVSDPGSGLIYTNLLDQMIDAVYFAMKRVGYPDVRLFIAETGWPSANIYNAATYNRNVVKKFTAKPPVGTPAKPGVVVPTLLFALYNENQKPGPGTERHFGLLYPNGTNVYGIDLSGKTPVSEYKPLPTARNNEPYKGKLWCVVGRKANATELGGATSYACGQGNWTCDEIRPGGKCYKPDSLVLHANYAFSSYWAQFKSSGGTCSFNGLTIPTKKDPSYGSCKFPSVTL